MLSFHLYFMKPTSSTKTYAWNGMIYLLLPYVDFLHNYQIINSALDRLIWITQFAKH